MAAHRYRNWSLGREERCHRGELHGEQCVTGMAAPPDLDAVTARPLRRDADTNHLRCCPAVLVSRQLRTSTANTAATAAATAVAARCGRDVPARGSCHRAAVGVEKVCGNEAVEVAEIGVAQDAGARAVRSARYWRTDTGSPAYTLCETTPRRRVCQDCRLHRQYLVLGRQTQGGGRR